MDENEKINTTFPVLLSTLAKHNKQLLKSNFAKELSILFHSCAQTKLHCGKFEISKH